MMKGLSVEEIKDEIEQQVRIASGSRRDFGCYNIFVKQGNLEFRKEHMDDTSFIEDPSFIGFFESWPDGDGYDYQFECNGERHSGDVEVDEDDR